MAIRQSGATVSDINDLGQSEPNLINFSKSVLMAPQEQSRSTSGHTHSIPVVGSL
ncbi:hypothetical protein L837_2457 [Mycobacterium avium MAV_061107_1842]|nr:hypothetical protein L837_2457 [Mycobacterium avium MAV_061107_1842]